MTVHDNVAFGLSVRKRPKKGRRITACVVVDDSAPLLSQCLASLRDVADSIIVVDVESSEDMASVRNDALDRATGGWVLMLDATHTLDPASIDVVRVISCSLSPNTSTTRTATMMSARSPEKPMGAPFAGPSSEQRRTNEAAIGAPAVGLAESRS